MTVLFGTIKIVTVVPDDLYFYVKSTTKAYPRDEDKKDIFQKAITGRSSPEEKMEVDPTEVYNLNRLTYRFENSLVLRDSSYFSCPPNKMRILDSLADDVPIKLTEFVDLNHSANVNNRSIYSDIQPKQLALKKIFAGKTGDIIGSKQLRFIKDSQVVDEPIQLTKLDSDLPADAVDNKNTAKEKHIQLRKMFVREKVPNKSTNFTWPKHIEFNECMGSLLCVVERINKNTYDFKVMLMPGKYTEDPVILAMLMKLFNPLYQVSKDNLTKQEAEQKKNSTVVDAMPKQFYGPQIVEACIAVWLSYQRRYSGMVITTSHMIKKLKPYWATKSEKGKEAAAESDESGPSKQVPDNMDTEDELVLSEAYEYIPAPKTYEQYLALELHNSHFGAPYADPCLGLSITKKDMLNNCWLNFTKTH